MMQDKEKEGLRRRIHFLEKHNQWFERCESAWCNPDPSNNPALGIGPFGIVQDFRQEAETVSSYVNTTICGGALASGNYATEAEDIVERYRLDYKTFSEPSETWEWDRQRHIQICQSAKKLIEELSAAESQITLLQAELDRYKLMAEVLGL